MSSASLLRTVLKVIRRRPVVTVLLVLLPVWGVMALREAVLLLKIAAVKSARTNGDLKIARAGVDELLVSRPHDREILLLAANLARRLEAYDEADRHLRTYESHHG